MKLHEIAEVDDWDSPTPAATTPKELEHQLQDVNKHMVTAQHEHDLTVNRSRDFTDRFLVQRWNPIYDNLPPNLKFKVGEREYGINPIEAKKGNVASMMKHATKLLLACEKSIKRVEKLARQVQKVKKALKQKTLTDLNSIPQKTIAEKDVPQKIMIGKAGIQNPYFKFPTRRYAGDLGHFPYWDSAAQAMYVKLSTMLKQFNLAPFTVMYSSAEDTGYKLGNGQNWIPNYFVAFAANDDFVWRREGGSNKFFWKGKKLSGEYVPGNGEVYSLRYQTAVFKHDDYDPDIF